MSLPPIGQAISMNAHASNSPLQVNVLGLVTLDFKGGLRAVVEQEIQSGWGGVRLRAEGFEMTADSPVLGKVVLSWANSGSTPLSEVRILDEAASTYLSTWYFDWTMTIEKPPGGGAPIELSSTKTAALVGDQLTGFPPQGGKYQLQQPVDFAPVGAPGQVILTLQQLPATVSYNP
ncbi:hypothetical protein OG906_43180 (plasmid) [Streptomyces sp. NBC_01426]|uniref:hypothetical protein n=1 Tax=Streptomyces sp. NBC_01426 TaxID=2975866 RepID=UPI002E3751FD|nr:hypothetical protein [Streptomyces sp. NBC_01426]